MEVRNRKPGSTETADNDGDLNGKLLGNRPIPIVVATEDHSFELDEEALAHVLLNDKIKDKKVAVISVAGAFRKGKSFLLDFFLRYLDRKDIHEDWLGSPTEALEGFSWRGGSERDTTGILLWSKPYLCTLPNGEEVVVLLMDTQGAFDSTSTVKDCATIFALSTMTCSSQVYNLSQNIQEDDLQHLQLFTEYGKLAMENSEVKPFQNLLFLVRDWSFPYEADYGDKGGDQILERRLKISQKQHPELQQVRTHVRECFDKIGCYLMPHPGLKVSTNPSFQGHLEDIDDEFKDQLQQLIPLLLAPENLVLKGINGQEVTCRGLLEYFKAYMKIFQGDELPEPKSMLLATAEANNLAALAAAKDLYLKEMDSICGGDMPYLAPNELERRNNTIRETCLDLFHNTRKMGGEIFSQEYAAKLTKEVDESFENYVKLNDSKNIFNAGRTPSVFLSIIVISYLLSSVFNMLGLLSFVRMCNLTVWMGVIMLVIWFYIRFTGEFRELGAKIDHLGEVVWDEVFIPLYQAILHRGAQAVASTTVSQLSGSKKKN